jgi:HNH endonuclease
MQSFTPPKEFWENHLKNGSCWEWVGQITYPKRSPKGYGVIWLKNEKKQVYVHRLSWILHNQQNIPKGMVIMHRCDNTICYNPYHLVIGTQRDNVDDMINKGREGIRLRATHCVRGHEYTAENTLIVNLRKKGIQQRKCRVCKNLSSKQYRLKRKKTVV